MIRMTTVVVACVLAGPACAGSTSLKRIVEPLKSKIEQIVATCGSRVVSTDMRGGVTPLHRHHRAVDVTGNPSCIYRLLKDWPGGVSTDYSTAPYIKHVHVSYCPPKHCDGLRPYEWGRRFAHSHHGHSEMSARRKQRSKTRAVASAGPGSSHYTPTF